MGTKEGNEFIIPVVPLTQILSSFIKHFATPRVFAKPSTTSTVIFLITTQTQRSGFGTLLLLLYAWITSVISVGSGQLDEGANHHCLIPALPLVSRSITLYHHTQMNTFHSQHCHSQMTNSALQYRQPVDWIIINQTNTIQVFPKLFGAISHMWSYSRGELTLDKPQTCRTHLHKKEILRTPYIYDGRLHRDQNE